MLLALPNSLLVLSRSRQLKRFPIPRGQLRIIGYKWSLSWNVRGVLYPKESIILLRRSIIVRAWWEKISIANSPPCHQTNILSTARLSSVIMIGKSWDELVLRTYHLLMMLAAENSVVYLNGGRGSLWFSHRIVCGRCECVVEGGEEKCFEASHI